MLIPDIVINTQTLDNTENLVWAQTSTSCRTIDLCRSALLIYRSWVFEFNHCHFPFWSLTCLHVCTKICITSTYILWSQATKRYHLIPNSGMCMWPTTGVQCSYNACCESGIQTCGLVRCTYWGRVGEGDPALWKTRVWFTRLGNLISRPHPMQETRGLGTRIRCSYPRTLVSEAESTVPVATTPWTNEHLIFYASSWTVWHLIVLNISHIIYHSKVKFTSLRLSVGPPAPLQEIESRLFPQPTAPRDSHHPR